MPGQKPLLLCRSIRKRPQQKTINKQSEQLGNCLATLAATTTRLIEGAENPLWVAAHAAHAFWSAIVNAVLIYREVPDLIITEETVLLRWELYAPNNRCEIWFNRQGIASCVIWIKGQIIVNLNSGSIEKVAAEIERQYLLKALSRASSR